jgi:hypothetical protein
MTAILRDHFAKRRAAVPCRSMAGSDSGHGGDRDDWFDEPDVVSPRRSRRVEPQQGQTGADDWLGSSDAGRSRLGGVQRLSRNARIVLGAAVLAVLLLIGLAAGGVFSGGSKLAATTTGGTGTTPATTTTQSTKPAGTPVAVPASTLKPGDTGAQVTILQRALKSLGYAPGAADGKYGPSTQKAVTRFQRAAKLTADGILGPKTLAALARAAARR